MADIEGTFSGDARERGPDVPKSMPPRQRKGFTDEQLEEAKRLCRSRLESLVLSAEMAQDRGMPGLTRSEAVIIAKTLPSIEELATRAVSSRRRRESKSALQHAYGWCRVDFGQVEDMDDDVAPPRFECRPRENVGRRFMGRIRIDDIRTLKDAFWTRNAQGFLVTIPSDLRGDKLQLAVNTRGAPLAFGLDLLGPLPESDERDVYRVRLAPSSSTRLAPSDQTSSTSALWRALNVENGAKTCVRPESAPDIRTVIEQRAQQVRALLNLPDSQIPASDELGDGKIVFKIKEADRVLTARD